ncbi:hypothetical protein CPB84DRAFT_1854597 [Gymnopilus junonius]|uniref:Uncharacterized protein n=1 Tax=Gymnopilus junonius TaxID=109634 RepID=A0A9P5N7I9_GYMJU|nr:hypothetical protein CPB84DRAFT_1854597 [Gymnopilus junonius]
MPYDLYLLKQGASPPPLFNSHWVLFVRSSGSLEQRTAIGTYIYVTGSRYEGFIFEVKRNWSPTCTTEIFRNTLIGEVQNASVVLSSPISEYLIENEARTALERTLLTLPAPGKSLRAPSATGPQVVKDCQWWIINALPYVRLNKAVQEVLDVIKQ